MNAVIDGDEIVYRDYTDISIAVATPKGLVVPVLRSADELSFADVEKARPCQPRSAGTVHAPLALFLLLASRMQAEVLVVHRKKHCRTATALPSQAVVSEA